jgi:hypothetical protein
MIDTIEIDARINMLVQQREEAMNRVVQLAGMLAKLQATLDEKEKASGDTEHSKTDD